jgi:hypothetical protein
MGYVCGAKESLLTTFLKTDKAKQPFSTAEDFICPVFLMKLKMLLVRLKRNRISFLPLVTQLRDKLQAVMQDVDDQLIENIQACPWYCIPMGKSIDREKKTILLCVIP